MFIRPKSVNLKFLFLIESLVNLQPDPTSIPILINIKIHPFFLFHRRNFVEHFGL